MFPKVSEDREKVTDRKAQRQKDEMQHYGLRSDRIYKKRNISYWDKISTKDC